MPGVRHLAFRWRETFPEEDPLPHAPPLRGETTTPAEAERITSAVTTWGGNVEARAFALEAGAPRLPLASVLADAELECLGGRGPRRPWRLRSRLRVAAIDPRDAFEIVFAAACFGGAYDDGQYGAYGRLAGWDTLGALVGASPEEPFERVVELVTRSQWYRFESDSGWFHDVAWKVGLGVVTVDGDRLAVLAGSDTD